MASIGFLDLGICCDGTLQDKHSKLLIKNGDEMPDNVLVLKISCYGDHGKDLLSDIIKKIKTNYCVYYSMYSKFSYFINNSYDYKIYEFYCHRFFTCNWFNRKADEEFTIDKMIEKTKKVTQIAGVSNFCGNNMIEQLEIPFIIHDIYAFFARNKKCEDFLQNMIENEKSKGIVNGTSEMQYADFKCTNDYKTYDKIIQHFVLRPILNYNTDIGSDEHEGKFYIVDIKSNYITKCAVKAK